MKLKIILACVLLFCSQLFAQSYSYMDGTAAPTPATVLTGTTGTITPGILLAGACGSGTVAVTNSTTSMPVAVSANTYPGDGVVAFAYVSSNGTVTVKVCAIIGLTPNASSYNVRVLQ